MKAALHPDEELRLNALYNLDILDTPSEPEFDEVVEVMTAFCGTPVSLITLIDADRQWFKARTGTDITETSRDMSFCAHTILEDGFLEVPDTSADPRFADNPLVKGEPRVRFYAGAVLESGDGLPLGTLCVLDVEPRELTNDQRRLLRVMARQVTAQFELRRALKIERQVTASLANTLLQQSSLLDQNELLRKEIDHRVKNSLQLVASFLGMQARKSDDPGVRVQLADAQSRVMAVASVHDQLHQSGQTDVIAARPFLEGLCANLAATKPVWVEEVRCLADNVDLPASGAMALGLAVSEMVANAFKHAYDETRTGVVDVAFRRDGAMGRLTVCDDGPGLPETFAGDSGRGLGMKVLSAVVAQLRGMLDHEGEDRGGCFRLSFPLAERQ